MPATTNGSNRHSPVEKSSGLPISSSQPTGRNSRQSTRRSTPVGRVPGTTTISESQRYPLDLNGYAESGRQRESCVPPPQIAKPSYKEYDDQATPNISTQNMQPLGEFPTHKAIEAMKKPFPYQAKKKGKGKMMNGIRSEGIGSAQFEQADNSTVTAATTASSDISARTSNSPSAPTQPSITPRAQPPNPWFNGNAPSSRTPQGRQRLSMVVQAAVHRSTITGNTDVGLAIKKLYNESLTDDGLAHLLDAVLAQKSTQEQFEQFQNYVRAARANPEPQNSDTPSLSNMSGDTKENGAIGVAKQSDLAFNPAGGSILQMANGRSKNANSNPSEDSPPHAMGIKSNASTPQPSEGLEPDQDGKRQQRPTYDELKRQRLPTYDELKQDSHIREPPRAPPGTRMKTKKRGRSPSMTRTTESSPVSVVADKLSTPSLSTSQTAAHPLPPKKKSKTNKTKVSPCKKAAAVDYTVVTAGIGEVPDHRRARHGSEEVSENEDVCAVCNGSGRFLCCERCPRSFHFTCLDPPLEEIPEGMWFCQKCQAQTNPPPKETRGLFSGLLDNINRQNPTSFRLPAHIRNYFVGVETGLLGEYVDARDAKQPKWSKSGFPEQYDTHRLRDKQGNALHCHDCGKSAVDGQRIISCDYCPLSWHMDCIKPMPMPNPPSVKIKWMCPAHADWALHRRRPKNAPIVDTFLRRGHKNDGLIEIENEEEEHFEEIQMTGVVYRLPERGIKLDFCDKVRWMNAQESAGRHANEGFDDRDNPPKRPRLSGEFVGVQSPTPVTSKDPVDMGVAVALLGMKYRADDMPIDASLVQSLLTEASLPIVDLLSTQHSVEHEIQQLQALQDLIAKRLETLANSSSEPPSFTRPDASGKSITAPVAPTKSTKKSTKAPVALTGRVSARNSSALQKQEV